MNQPDTQPDESPKNACAVNATVRTIAPDKLRKLLSDHRNKLKEVRWNLLAQVKTIEKEIITYDALIEELTIE